MHLRRVPFVFIALLGACGPLQAQDAPPSRRPRLNPREWVALHTFITALQTEGGTRQYYEQHSQLSQTFPNPEGFFDLTQRWRPRITPLPADLDKALQTVDIAVRDGEAGLQFFVTYYNAAPPNAITLMKTTWRGTELIGVNFLKGFAHPESD